MAIRVKSSLGSGNARWRRKFGRGNTDQPESDTFRVSAEKKAEHEKLNDERGASPCQSAAAKTEPNRENLNRMDKGQLLYSCPRNQCVVAHWKLCRNGNFGHTCQAD